MFILIISLQYTCTVYAGLYCITYMYDIRLHICLLLYTIIVKHKISLFYYLIICKFYYNIFFMIF